MCSLKQFEILKAARIAFGREAMSALICGILKANNFPGNLLPPTNPVAWRES
jgi:hypothetical protein